MILPIYNVEKFIEKCVRSLINQTYKNIEIILVDDGSKDSSGAIADNLAKEDSRIRVIHKDNGGLSDARNFGIENATGDYICFVDSDDYVKSDYVKSMYDNLVDNDVKISCCGFCHLYENGTIKEINFQNISKKYVKDDAQIYLNIVGYYNVSSCNKLFDISLFKNIRFPVGKKSEDWFVMYKLFDLAGAVYYDSDSKYIYRQRYGSITKNSKANTDSIEAAREVYNFFKDSKEISKFASQSLIFAIIGIYNFYLIRDDMENAKKYRQEALIVYKNSTYSRLSVSRRIQLFLFKHFVFLYNLFFKKYDAFRKKK